MSKRYYTSDLHLGHLLVSKLRGFASVEEHDTELIRRWNDVVTSRDTVIVAGDVVMGGVKKNLPKIGELNGTKLLVAGNHDSCWPGKEGCWSHMAAYLEYFSVVQPFLKVKIAGQQVLVSHFPYTADRTDSSRHNQFRLPNQGSWLLHGHTHSRLRWTSSREIHVGLDAWYLAPVPEFKIGLMITEQMRKENDAAGIPQTGDSGGEAPAGICQPPEEAEHPGSPDAPPAGTPGTPGDSGRDSQGRQNWRT